MHFIERTIVLCYAMVVTCIKSEACDKKARFRQPAKSGIGGNSDVALRATSSLVQIYGREPSRPWPEGFFSPRYCRCCSTSICPRNGANGELK